jgi:hypothetical protein
MPSVLDVWGNGAYRPKPVSPPPPVPGPGPPPPMPPPLSDADPMWLWRMGASDPRGASRAFATTVPKGDETWSNTDVRFVVGAVGTVLVFNLLLILLVIALLVQVSTITRLNR